MSAADRVWFISGCSTGFGRHLAEQALGRGEKVVATARNPAQLRDLVAPHGARALALQIDMTDENLIARAASEAERHFGRIDVLVNSAGYGYFSAIEEGDDAEIRRQMETNVFGLMSLTRHVLPGMRRRRSGRIVNFSSIGGLVAFPALGYYHASKFAVEGFSEALAREVAPLGIGVTIVEPGRFRTDWAGRSAIDASVSIEDYRDTAGVRREERHVYSGTQRGDPARGAAAIIKIVDSDEPPMRLLLGSDAYRTAMSRLDTLRGEFEKWKDLSLSTDFPEE